MRAIDYILDIDCVPEDEELIQARLFLTASTGNVSRDGGLTAYFDSSRERDAAATLFAGARTIDRPRIDWLEHYQQSLKPLFIGSSFVVVPDPSLVHLLVIPQEQAFGTGSHESTALCLELLETLDVRGATCLDAGSGSGILALAMKQLGARKVIAFDNDLDAYAALRDNPRRNGLDINAFIGTLDALRGSAFDVITMNILPEVIVPLLPQVRRHLGGFLIVSGILTTFRDSFIEAARDLRIVNERTKGEWWAAVLSM